jgi:hypothetical protein
VLAIRGILPTVQGAEMAEQGSNRVGAKIGNYDRRKENLSSRSAKSNLFKIMPPAVPAA